MGILYGVVCTSFFSRAAATRFSGVVFAEMLQAL